MLNLEPEGPAWVSIAAFLMACVSLWGSLGALEMDNRNMSKDAKSAPMKCGVSWLMPELQGFLFLTLKSPLLVPLTDPRKGMAKLQLTFLWASFNIVLYSSGVLHFPVSPRETGIHTGVRSKPSLSKYPKQDTLFQTGLPLCGHEGRLMCSWLGTVYTIFFNCEFWNHDCFDPSFCLLPYKGPHVRIMRVVCVHTPVWVCAYVPTVPSQKENRLLRYKRGSHQCLISFGGMDAYNASI